jgi:hypothetical protein
MYSRGLGEVVETARSKMEGFVEDCSSTLRFVDWNVRRFVGRIIV